MEITEFIARHVKDIESRLVTMRALTQSMVNAAKTEEDRTAAQQRLDLIDKLIADTDDRPPGEAA